MSVKYYRSKKKTFVELPVSLLWKQKLYRLVRSVNPPYIPTSFGIEPENCNIADANPYDAKSYAVGGIYQFFGKTVVLSGYDGTDRLLACTGFHLTGQLAILKCRVKEFLKNNHDTHGRIVHNNIGFISKISNLTARKILKIVGLTELERVYRFTFLIYVCILSCTLYGHCYIGECLIEELINRILIDLQFDVARTCAMRFIIATDSAGVLLPHHIYRR
ncbi:odorant receptor 13a-like [Vespula squamosa]|uniref:Odorant receptor 13a-like n=1 Tax=Vespula squamosa TaxID=30214 RepID=A0ABD1ZYU3_VESSQ